MKYGIIPQRILNKYDSLSLLDRIVTKEELDMLRLTTSVESSDHLRYRLYLFIIDEEQ